VRYAAVAVLSPGELLGPCIRSGLVRIVRTGIERAGDETYSFLRRGGESKTSDPKKSYHKSPSHHLARRKLEWGETILTVEPSRIPSSIVADAKSVGRGRVSGAREKG